MKISWQLHCLHQHFLPCHFNTLNLFGMWGDSVVKFLPHVQLYKPISTVVVTVTWNQNARHILSNFSFIFFKKLKQIWVNFSSVLLIAAMNQTHLVVLHIIAKCCLSSFHQKHFYFRFFQKKKKKFALKRNGAT